MESLFGKSEEKRTLVPPEQQRDENQYLCAICGKRFYSKTSVQQHTHKHRPYRFKCQYCSHMACTRSDLSKHERIHTGERPYMCHICGEGYLQSSHLHDHARVHTGAKPFKCDLCERCFSKKSDMLRHRRIHTGDLPYLCLVCGKAFRQSAQCSNHVKKHHPQALTHLAAKHNDDASSSKENDPSYMLDDLNNYHNLADPEIRDILKPLSQNIDMLLANVTKDATDMFFSECNTDLVFDSDYLEESDFLSNPFINEHTESLNPNRQNDLKYETF